MRIFTCNHCSKIHLEVGHAQIHFVSLEQLKIYLEYLNSIDVKYYAAVNREKGLSKVIILPLNDCASVHLAFTTQEFEELKVMIRQYLSDKSKPENTLVNYRAFRLMNWN